jgi:tetratricopeptide (TPR) repeat protein
MDTMPWNYWTEDGKPKPETEEVLTTLESVLKREPQHAGACHYYIHAVEASPNPERGLAAAHRLRYLVPGAGHLVHMPSHIYLRLGNYHEASLCNERAVDVDEAYISRYRVKGIYPAMYFTHNSHFLSYSAGMEGRSGDSIRAGRKAATGLTREDMMHMPMTQWIKATPPLVLARFGRWQEVLQEPKPEADFLYVTAMWYYARGLACARLRQRGEAESAAASLEKIAQDKAVEALELPTFPGMSLIRLARTVLAAEVAGARGERDALLRLEEAVHLQDKLPYMEPPFWYFPLRQRLGAALVEGVRFQEAEMAYREDLKRHPENGWSLFGLLQCLRAQGKFDAAGTEKRFRDAWKHADVTLTASSF